MKSLLEKLIRLRNPMFHFDKAVSSRMLVSLLIDKIWYLLRGLKYSYTKPNIGLMLGKGVKIMFSWNIEWGKYVKIEDYVHISALGSGKVVIGDHTGIGAFSRIIISTSFNNIGQFIQIGNNVGIGEYAYLGGAGGLSIGNDCIIGQYFSCHPENHNYGDLNLPIRHQGTSRYGISIGNNCWIGSKVTVLDGVSIGENCVIAAGAVVTKSMPANSVIAGVPAKVIKSTSQTSQAA